MSIRVGYFSEAKKDDYAYLEVDVPGELPALTISRRDNGKAEAAGISIQPDEWKAVVAYVEAALAGMKNENL